METKADENLRLARDGRLHFAKYRRRAVASVASLYAPRVVCDVSSIFDEPFNAANSSALTVALRDRKDSRRR